MELKDALKRQMNCPEQRQSIQADTHMERGPFPSELNQGLAVTASRGNLHPSQECIPYPKNPTALFYPTSKDFSGSPGLKSQEGTRKKESGIQPHAWNWHPFL